MSELGFSTCKSCERKVDRDYNGMYSCQLCGVRRVDCSYQYKLSAKFADHTATLPVTIFDAAAEELFEVSATAMMRQDAEFVKSKIVLALHQPCSIMIRKRQFSQETDGFSSTKYYAEKLEILEDSDTMITFYVNALTALVNLKEAHSSIRDESAK